MEKYLEQLASSLLFKSIEKSKIPKILKTIPYTVKSYKKDEVIAVEGEDCHSLGIILEGRVEIH
ncbi:MAG TPA: Crp/Fnr family transcriptional regulator, partial [Tissierellaceae bacterium]|nr:Crp/Fnr family transcriptional regulator [Tissierellaceae bacterium]